MKEEKKTIVGSLSLLFTSSHVFYHLDEEKKVYPSERSSEESDNPHLARDYDDPYYSFPFSLLMFGFSPSTTMSIKKDGKWSADFFVVLFLLILNR